MLLAIAIDSLKNAFNTQFYKCVQKYGFVGVVDCRFQGLRGL